MRECHLPSPPLSFMRVAAAAIALIAVISVLGGPPVLAQAWPSKAIRIILAGPAGGTLDVTARLLAEAMKKELGSVVIVDPRPGGAGAIAINELLAASRDGHTLLVGPNSLVSEIPHIVRLKVDAATAMTPLAELARSGLILVCTPSLPVNSLPELIAQFRTNPATRSYASYSPGTMSHILGLQLGKIAGTDLTHVGYKGSPLALADVMGGHVPWMFDGIPTALPLIRAGRLKALAVSLPSRSPLLPDVPTVAELGYPQLEAIVWIGLWVTPDVPSAVQARLRDVALKATMDPAMRERQQQIGLEPAQPRSTDDLKDALRADYDRVGALLKAINFKTE